MDIQYDVIIVGAGPAGMTAAIYASRAGLKTVMLEKSAPGGKLILTAEIANWPGLKITTGVDLAFEMYEHSTQFGAEYLYGEVTGLVNKDDHFEVLTLDQSYTTKTVILASGTVQRMLNIPGEKEYAGRGVSYCAVCDGAFFKNQEVAVIGGGNSALEEAIYLTEFASKVHLIIRRNEFTAEEESQSKLLSNPKINVITQSIPLIIKGDDNKVNELVIENVNTKEKTSLAVAAIFPFIGSDSSVESTKIDVELDKGFIKVNEKKETSVKGVFAAGDVTSKQLRQIVTAVNDGAIAAQNAFEYIKNNY